MQLSITDMILNAGLMGQLVMLTLLIFSLVSWSIVIMKARLFRKSSRQSGEFLEQFWSSNNLSEANGLVDDYPYCPEAAVFSAGFSELQKINRIRTRKEPSNVRETLDMQLATMENLQRAIDKAETQQITRLGSSLPFLATTGNAAPFIGLFGTVWGIMSSFHDIGVRGSASLAVVAPGISEALVATAAGLAVAIPAVVFYNHYSNKLEGIDSSIQNFSTDLLNLVERDLLGRLS